MTKSNKSVIIDYVNSTWLGHRLISHNKNLIVADNILFSYGVPMAVYERGKYCPYRINFNLSKGRHKEHFNLLMKEIVRYNDKNMYLLLSGNLKTSNFVRHFDGVRSKFRKNKLKG